MKGFTQATIATLLGFFVLLCIPSASMADSAADLLDAGIQEKFAMVEEWLEYEDPANQQNCEHQDPIQAPVAPGGIGFSSPQAPGPSFDSASGFPLMTDSVLSSSGYRISARIQGNYQCTTS